MTLFESPRLRVLFVAFSRSSLGHIVRSTTAAARFAADGHDVAVACHEEVRHIPEKAGLAWLPIEEIGPAPAWRGMDDPEQLRAFVRTRLASPEYVSASLEDELRVIDLFRPDVVIADMRNTAGVAASMRGVTAFTLHNLRLFQHPMHVVLPEVLVTLDQLGVEQAHARHVLGSTVLVPDIAEIDGLSDVPRDTAALICSLTDEIRHLGPLLSPELLSVAARASESESGPGPRATENRRRLLHVTLGGSGVGDQQIRRVVEAVAGLGLDIGVTLGAESLQDQVTALEDELAAVAGDSAVTVTGFRHDVVERVAAADAAVVHGGHGSIIEALVCGTPLVFLPGSLEQRENARKIRELGLGVVLAPDDDAAAVRAKVVKALSLKETPGPRRFARALVAADGAGRLVDYVTSSQAIRTAVAAP
ncbi:glycosyltransferase 28 domain protein [Catenulispora acidiphila DSM 44928]|uniref:Glycosyltransferase 28 domain protein n=1 Tax=Catenulispora acidiphila (strain DSM 44928 / JCM 14897 / NBRC 102108 / NRRL B-24433 / ID139908) TaxID=479433 RepID=C7PX82_CATAD|nr:glycosyltransferase [Catenulispora acidiphila]ACU69433.1 glycosyltransferase 28 domain protein [Catenulispora acidiphila DSM 44928]